MCQNHEQNNSRSSKIYLNKNKEMKKNSEYVNKDQHKQISWNQHSWEIFENLRHQENKEQQKHSDIQKLQEVFMYLFETQYLSNYCYYTKHPQQCSDWSDLYSIIKYDWKDTIVKVWCGEFNTQIFNTSWIRELKWLNHTPIPLFVVNQSNSYLANQHIQESRKNTPKKYLDQYAIIVIPKKWKAYFRGYQERKNPINFWDINIKDYQTTLNQWRWAILHKEFPNGQFQICIDIINRFQKWILKNFTTPSGKIINI
jgi:hypothetical protein